jgi:hypothetical protein
MRFRSRPSIERDRHATRADYARTGREPLALGGHSVRALHSPLYRRFVKRLILARQKAGLTQKSPIAPQNTGSITIKCRARRLPQYAPHHEP